VVKSPAARKELEVETATLGTLLGRLRAVHLAAHLETSAILDARQIVRYNELRGYVSGGSPPAHDPAKAHGGQGG